MVFFSLHHVNWVYISSVIHMCVCVCVCGVLKGGSSLGFFSREREVVFWRFYLLLLDRLTPEGVQSLLDLSVRPGNWSED